MHKIFNTSKHMRYAHATRTAVSGQCSVLSAQCSVVSGQLILFKSTDCATRTLREQYRGTGF
ncbi:MAG: hypothetical protein F6J98_18025 [Moorea sp. SIO4G2]|nr:hypothetical protein [Moorena sp. SIO4G2]